MNFKFGEVIAFNTDNEHYTPLMSKKEMNKRKQIRGKLEDIYEKRRLKQEIEFFNKYFY